MAEYYKKISDDGEYSSSAVVLGRTQLVANNRDYKLGYWMMSFSRLFVPGIYFRATEAFGRLENWKQLRYLMEHTTFYPKHPLYNLDYETCSAIDRKRLDVFREIAFYCCICWYYIIKEERPNLLPKEERTPLTRKEEQYIRWMKAYYGHVGTFQKRKAFYNILNNARDYFAPKTPTEAEVEAFNEFQIKIQRQQKQERRLLASRQEAKRLTRLLPRVYISSHPCIKQQFREVFGKDNQFVVIRHMFESGNLDYKGKLSAAKELVVMLSNDIRSHLLLRYVASHFHGDISIIHIVGEYEDLFPLSLDNNELSRSCQYPVRLSKEQHRKLSKEFYLLKNSASDFFRLQGSEICSLSHEEVFEHITKQFVEGENRYTDVIVNCMANAPEGWPKGDSFYFCCIRGLIIDGVIIVTRNRESLNKREMPTEWYLKIAEGQHVVE